MVSFITLGPAKPINALGSAILISPSIEKEAVAPPKVGLVKSDMKGIFLSDKRAKSTAQYVISKGIDENRISGVGMGEEDPKIDCTSGCSKDDHAKNRRSEFIIVSR